MQGNPDVAAAYANRANDPNLASTLNMSPEEFASTHYNKFGKGEQRTWGDTKTPGGGVVAPFGVRTGPEATYGAVDWNAMNPFSAQNKPVAAAGGTSGGASSGGLLGPVEGGGNEGYSGGSSTGSGNVFGSIQNAINTPAGAGAAYAASKMGLLGPMTQNPANVPVTDLSTYGGYSPAAMEAAIAASESNAAAGNESAMGDTSDGIGYAKGGEVKRVMGPNPKGPDDGYAALDKGEVVIRKSAVKKYGKNMLSKINSGNYKKG